MISYPRRRVVVALSYDLFLWLLTAGNTIRARCTHGLPEGARFVGLEYRAEQDSWLLVFEHESFAPVPEGEMLPCLRIEYADIASPGAKESEIRNLQDGRWRIQEALPGPI